MSNQVQVPGRVSIEITRRDFIKLMAVSSAGLVAGCAVNPVTGESQLMLVSEDQEIGIDRKNSPHQFSADYGTLQDKALNNYIEQTGLKMAAKTHRPQMPYSFQGVNATYVNAYAFPGGSIACTRGILLELENEAELAALMGHELGHVNARHTAEQMSKSILASAAVSGLAIYAGYENRTLGTLASSLGSIGAGALLAKYSRDNEREADALGMEYMVRSGYRPEGMIGLMDMLRGMSRREPSVIELMFATHPMSDERYETAVETAQTDYSFAKVLPLHRERYMDHTAYLRYMKEAIHEMQKGEKAMAKKGFPEAEGHFRHALKLAPDDYAALVMMSKCQMAQGRYEEARHYAQLAKQTYPSEAQAYHLSGISRLLQNDFDGAYMDFSLYESQLPGNPNTVFFKAYSLERMGRRRDSAVEYNRYLQVVQEGDQARHAYRRLVEWGYVRSR
jgi:predicted Zn-dependent protease